VSDELSRRNTEGVMQAVRNMEALTRETRVMVDNLNAMAADLRERVMLLERERDQRRIAAMGRGPTDASK
jgi:hypothetical protein